METLVYFLICGALIFFMMRFGCGAHVMGHGHGHHHSDAPARGDGFRGDRNVSGTNEPGEFGFACRWAGSAAG